MSEGAHDVVRPFAFPVARGSGATKVPAWIGASPAVTRPACFPSGSADEPAAVPPRAAPAPLASPPASPTAAPCAPSIDTGSAQRDADATAFARAAIEHAAACARAIAACEDQLLDLSLAIASAIVERELERDSALHAALAQSALETLGDPAGARLRASHEAYAAILDAFGSPVIVSDGVAVQVTLDPSLEGVGCVVENEQGRVDARISERLRTVRRALDDERRRIALDEVG